MPSQQKSSLEKASGSIPVSLGATALASAFGGVTALLPVLVQSLASERHSARIENCFADISKQLEKHSEKLKDLSDAQYKVINEAVVTVLSTVEEEKIKYLKTIISNTIFQDDLSSKDATFLSRIIRDLSAEDITYLYNYYGNYDGIILDDGTNKDKINGRSLCVMIGSEEEMVVSSLINLGLIYEKMSAWGYVEYQFSPLVGKLLKLLK